MDGDGGLASAGDHVRGAQARRWEWMVRRSVTWPRTRPSANLMRQRPIEETSRTTPCTVRRAAAATGREILWIKRYQE